jgi:hypothetical protein
MKAELIIPIDVLRGKLNKDGYYFRMYHGQQVVQRCPNRTYHERTFAEIANQKRFSIIAAEVNKRIGAGTQKNRKQLWKQVVKELGL